MMLVFANILDIRVMVEKHHTVFATSTDFRSPVSKKLSTCSCGPFRNRCVDWAGWICFCGAIGSQSESRAD